jgi:hypothetical protein
MSNNLTEYPLLTVTNTRYIRNQRRTTLHNGTCRARISATRNTSKCTGPKPVSHVQPANTVWFTKGVETVKRPTSINDSKSESVVSSIDAETTLKYSWAKPLPAVVAVNETPKEPKHWAKWLFV